MEVVLLIIHVITSIAIVIVILLQSGKGGGLGSGFGGASAAATQIFGGRGAGNFLSRTTVGLAAVFMATSLSLAYISSQPRSLMDLDSGDGVTGPAEDEIIESGSGAPEAQPPADTPAPEGGAPADAQQMLDQLNLETEEESGAADQEPAPVEEDEGADGAADTEANEDVAPAKEAPSGSGASATPTGSNSAEEASDTAPEKARTKAKKKADSAAPGGDTVEANAEEETILAPGKTGAPEGSE